MYNSVGTFVLVAGVSYFDSPTNGIKKELFFLVFDVILYAGLLSIVEMGYIEKMMNKLVMKMYGAPPVMTDGTIPTKSDDVQREKFAVDTLANYSLGKWRWWNSVAHICLTIAKFRSTSHTIDCSDHFYC